MSKSSEKRQGRSRQGLLPTIELQLLLQLVRGSAHGYGMMKAIAAETGGRFAPGPATLYVALRRLVDRKMIEPAAASEGRRRRQRYRLTDAGRAKLDEQLEMLDDVLIQARRAGWSPPREDSS